MEQNKDQSGAITLERAGFKLASHVATPGGPIMASVTDVYEKDGMQLVHSYAMGGESWSVGAAVRGEAVAESKSISLSVAILTIPYPEHVDQLGNNEWVLAYKKGHQDARNSAAAVAAAVSARAADAPSEPSEHAKFQAAYARINHSTPGGGWADLNGGTDDYCEPDVQAAWLLWKSRAADALDSQPTEPTGYVRISELKKLESNRVAGVGMMVQKEGGDGWTPIYASSQPTELDGCAECRNTYCMSGEVCKACGDVAMQGWKGGRQPTDGGVRNG